ncbi:Agrin-like protein [Leptotrombidium deliense]|uniref:Agrin-like protein n=1 Tax=Leptotrombidium deliense TaxID=299467 RepID=A0A443S264_9ACAR|nr:Agrin-like protein [Leptotrombidium deliense]
MCHLQRKSCLTQVNITKLHDGFCSTHSFASKNERKQSCSPEDCPFGGQCLIEFKQEPIIRCHCPQCSDEYSPVCGSDNISYNNECSLRRASCEQKKTIHVLRQGLCSECSFAVVQMPNLIRFRLSLSLGGCQELKCKHYATCESNYESSAECVCPQVCIRVDAPVCGSDGITYENECELRVRSCKLQTPISVASVSPCGKCSLLCLTPFITFQTP